MAPPYGPRVFEDEDNSRTNTVIEKHVIGQNVTGLEVDGHNVIVSLQNGTDLLFDLTEFGQFSVGVRRTQ